jgi:hypothetical protein
MTAGDASRPQRPTVRSESLPNLARRILLAVIGTVLSKKGVGEANTSIRAAPAIAASVSDTNSGLHAKSHWRATLAVRHHECRRGSASHGGNRDGGEATKQLWGVKTVSTVSTAAALENTLGTWRGPPRGASKSSIDAFADGADCRAGRLCARCPQPNDARPRSPLTTKANFNSQRSKGRLRAAEPTGQSSGRFWPPYTRPRRVIS